MRKIIDIITEAESTNLNEWEVMGDYDFSNPNDMARLLFDIAPYLIRLRNIETDDGWKKGAAEFLQTIRRAEKSIKG